MVSSCTTVMYPEKESDMSFSSEVKEELAKHISPARHCQIAELAVGARADDDLIDVTEQESEVKFQFEEEDTSTDDATGEFSQVYTYIIYK